jgi:hypothetical protein
MPDNRDMVAQGASEGNSQALKPCPLCGGIAITYLKGLDGRRVECNQCRCGICSVSEGYDVFEHWNRRAAPKVKPLVWRQHGGSEIADDPLGGIWTREHRSDGEMFWPPGVDMGIRGSADADYERRIREALD